MLDCVRRATQPSTDRTFGLWTIIQDFLQTFQAFFGSIFLNRWNCVRLEFTHFHDFVNALESRYGGCLARRRN